MQNDNDTTMRIMTITIMTTIMALWFVTESIMTLRRTFLLSQDIFLELDGVFFFESETKSDSLQMSDVPPYLTGGEYSIAEAMIDIYRELYTAIMESPGKTTTLERLKKKGLNPDIFNMQRLEDMCSRAVFPSGFTQCSRKTIGDIIKKTNKAIEKQENILYQALQEVWSPNNMKEVEHYHHLYDNALDQLHEVGENIEQEYNTAVSLWKKQNRPKKTLPPTPPQLPAKRKKAVPPLRASTKVFLQDPAPWSTREYRFPEETRYRRSSSRKKISREYRFPQGRRRRRSSSRKRSSRRR